MRHTTLTTLDSLLQRDTLVKHNLSNNFAMYFVTGINRVVRQIAGNNGRGSIFEVFEIAKMRVFAISKLNRCSYDPLHPMLPFSTHSGLHVDFFILAIGSTIAKWRAIENRPQKWRKSNFCE
jgi:hypothetical protein